MQCHDDRNHLLLSDGIVLLCIIKGVGIIPNYVELLVEVY